MEGEHYSWRTIFRSGALRLAEPVAARLLDVLEEDERGRVGGTNGRFGRGLLGVEHEKKMMCTSVFFL